MIVRSSCAPDGERRRLPATRERTGELPFGKARRASCRRQRGQVWLLPHTWADNKGCPQGLACCARGLAWLRDSDVKRLLVLRSSQ